MAIETRTMLETDDPEIWSLLQRDHARIVVGCVENLPRFVHPEVVGAGAIQVKERDLLRVPEIGYIHHVDIPAGAGPDNALSLLPDEEIAVLA